MNKQLGVGIAYPNGETDFHPRDTDADAWSHYWEIKDANPDATVWVGVRDIPDEETP